MLKNRLYAFSNISAKNWLHGVIVNLENSSTWVIFLLYLKIKYEILDIIRN